MSESNTYIVSPNFWISHLSALSPTWDKSLPQEIPVHDLWKGQNCQVVDKCIDKASLPPFP